MNALWTKSQRLMFRCFKLKLRYARNQGLIQIKRSGDWNHQTLCNRFLLIHPSQCMTLLKTLDTFRTNKTRFLRKIRISWMKRQMSGLLRWLHEKNIISLTQTLWTITRNLKSSSDEFYLIGWWRFVANSSFREIHFTHQ